MSAGTELLRALIALAQRAAAPILDHYRGGYEIAYKGPDDPVTDADKAANKLICSHLRGAYPDIPIVAEESAEETFAGYRGSERVFFVDPIDGTKEFIRGNGEFVVMLGLVVRDQATVGVVHQPTTGTTWYGEVGYGAFKQDADGLITKVTPTACSALQDARLVVSRSHRSRAAKHASPLLGIQEVLTMGSAGLKGASVASGEADIYLSAGVAGKRWDACAIDALVTASGGRFSDAFGNRIDYRSENLANDRGLLATAPALHAPTLAGLKRVRTSGDLA